MTSGSDMSCLLVGEDITGNVFRICDVSRTGCVQVSRLVDFIKVATGIPYNNDQVQDDRLKLLVDLLDPSGTNPQISVLTYRSGISRWIQRLKENEHLDAVELKNHLEHVEQQNKRLGKEVSELRIQLNTADDTVSQLKQENIQLKHENSQLKHENSQLKQEIIRLKDTLKCNQATIEYLSTIRRENEDLKRTLDNSVEDLRVKLARTNKVLSGNVAELQKRVKLLASEIWDEGEEMADADNEEVNVDEEAVDTNDEEVDGDEEVKQRSEARGRLCVCRRGRNNADGCCVTAATSNGPFVVSLLVVLLFGLFCISQIH